MTWSADTDIDAREILARTVLSAISQAAVDRGASAITVYTTWRQMAYDEIGSRFASRGYDVGSLTNTAGLLIVEVALALAILFESASQWLADGSADIYARKAEWWRARYAEEMAAVRPSTDRRAEGPTFTWERG